MPTIDKKGEKKTFKIAIVASRFNEPITGPLVEGAQDRLQELDFQQEQIQLVWVPGAVEIPLAVQRLAQQGIYSAIVALGAVIQGETNHYDYVCGQVSEGCQSVCLQYDVPVIFGVLTTQTVSQAQARIGGDKGHKGKEAIDCAVEMVSVLEAIG